MVSSPSVANPKPVDRTNRDQATTGQNAARDRAQRAAANSTATSGLRSDPGTDRIRVYPAVWDDGLPACRRVHVRAVPPGPGRVPQV
uniref:Uncharacterized protein n=1 Tax=uncultured Planctomycetota bacterium TaxID=120965 RepID=H5SFR3_9BACT|nr:hypothetical protein HGMM_F22C11C14 [uncultured Planctomycetota bacterium]